MLKFFSLENHIIEVVNYVFQVRENEEVKARDYIKKSIRNTMHLDIKRQKQGRQVLFLFILQQ